MKALVLSDVGQIKIEDILKTMVLIVAHSEQHPLHLVI